MADKLLFGLVFMAALLPLGTAIQYHQGPSYTARSHGTADGAGWEQKCSNIHSGESLNDCLDSILNDLDPTDPIDSLNLLDAFKQMLQGISDWLRFGVGRCNKDTGSIKEVCEVADAIGTISTQIGEVRNTFEEIVKLPQKIYNFIQDKVNELIQSFDDIIDGVRDTFDIILNPLESVRDGIRQFFDGIIETLEVAFGG